MLRTKEDKVHLKYVMCSQPSLELPRVRRRKDPFHQETWASTRKETASVLEEAQLQVSDTGVRFLSVM